MFMTILAASGGGAGGIAALLPFVLIAVAMYFLLIRPQRRRMQEQKALASAVQEGDEVMTTAGVYGFVTAIEDDIIWLEIAEGVDIRVARAAVSRRVMAPGDTGATAAPQPAAVDDVEEADEPAPAPEVKGRQDPASAD
jgi:preprotein translocase subunit YajC